ncbi:surface-adhesin E family protein [Collimonas sp.]|uniref:surface-adhesin E family protein n=1 Tax=Collimonas sp. TaxID=1963772 RepID=UPI002BB488A8|nr:surface-adhesin E family protein [Collimonas sp.]HWX00963.1 surface-adhesin E family protein [Collimonas sp.]
MKKLALTLTLGLACVAANAADWQSVGSSDTSELKLDQASIKETKGIREAWSMWNFKEPRKNDGDPKALATFQSYQDFTEYDCKAKTLRLSKEILFAGLDGAGAKVDHSDALKGATFVKPAAGSVAEVMMNFVCTFPLDGKAAPAGK